MSETNGTVLVAGGAGQVGEGIVRAFLDRAWTVLVPSRSADRLDALRRRIGAGDRLHLRAGEVGDPGGAREIAEWAASETGGLDAVVASLGGWWQGKRLVEVEPELWHRLLDDSLTAHFIAARTFLPLLAQRPGASYTLINGGGGLQAISGSGPISVSAAAQLMMKDVLAREHERDAVRINTLVLGTPVRTRSRPDGHTDWITAEDAGRHAVRIASEEGAGIRGQTIVLGLRGSVREAGAAAASTS